MFEQRQTGACDLDRHSRGHFVGGGEEKRRVESKQTQAGKETTHDDDCVVHRVVGASTLTDAYAQNQEPKLTEW